MSKKISELTSATPAAADLVEFSRLSPTVTYTATTLSALASDNSFNDSASQLIIEGFVVGMSVKVTGFTGNAANNIFTGRITALTASKMTIGGADGDPIVDDAAGESVTITAWESARGTVANLGGGSTQGRHDIPIAPGSWYADQTAPPLWAGTNGAADQPDQARWSFDPTTEQAVWCVVQFPKKWNLGTITYDVTWFRGAGTNPTVVWSLRAVAIGDGDSVAVNYGTAQAVTDTGATSGNFYRTPESAALTIAGTPIAHDLIFLELRRKPGDASDTFDANAELEMVTLHITTNADTDA